MDKKKTNIFKENMIAIIIIIVVLAIAITYFVIDKVNGSKIYESPIMNNERIEYDNLIFSENEYRIFEVNTQDMALRYYRYINYYLVNYPEKIWDILDPQQRKEYGNVAEFKRDIKKKVNVDTLSNTLIKYGVDESSSVQRKYVLVDSEMNSYTVLEKGVWNITVEVKGRVSLDDIEE